MELGLAGKVALVTGSSRGIGRGIAVALAQEGCDLVLTGTDEAALKDAAAAVTAHGRKAKTVAIDLRKDDGARGADRDGPEHLRTPRHPGEQCRHHQARRFPDPHRRRLGRRLCAQILRPCAALARRLAAAEGERRLAGRIGGTSGRVPTAGFTIGSSVNAAVAAFSKALADLGKTDGVQVNCIHPSYVDTERFARRVKADMERTGKSEAEVREWHRKDIGITRLGTTDDVAGLVAFIVSPRGRWLHGATIDLDGGEVKAF